MKSDDNGSGIPGDQADHDVGYGRPPKGTQFRPGRSGNPAGRRKSVRNLKTDVQRTLKVPLKVNVSGCPRKISTQEGALLLLREKVLKGDARAIDGLLEFARLFNNEAAEIGPAQALSSEDQAILDAFRAEITAPSNTAAPPSREDEHPESKPKASK
jgi:hypothetical protein